MTDHDTENPSGDEQVEAPKIEEMDGVIALNDTMEIRTVDVSELHEQDINPNVQPDEMFQQLEENIKKRGKLESLPYVNETDDDELEIISGHHRTRAAKSAGLEQIPVIVENADLDRDAVKAKQLAHNAIDGEQDDQLVKQLYDSIEDVDYRIESFIDTEDLDLPPEEYRVDRVDAGLERHTVNIMFLPRQMEDFDEAIEALSPETERVYLADVDDWSDFAETVNAIRDVEDIKSIAAVLSRMCEIVRDTHLDQSDLAAAESEELEQPEASD